MLKKVCPREKWARLVNFLDKEIRILEETCLSEENKIHSFRRDSKNLDTNKASSTDDKKHFVANGQNMRILTCHICGKDDHKITTNFRNKEVIQYFACKVFVEMTPSERFKKLRERGLCYQCLAPGAYLKNDKNNFHMHGKWFKRFVCQDKSHEKYDMKKHLLVCEEHLLVCEEHIHNNHAHLERYITEEILSNKVRLGDFSKQIKLSFHLENTKINLQPLYVPPALRRINQAKDNETSKQYVIRNLDNMNIETHRLFKKNKKKVQFTCYKE